MGFFGSILGGISNFISGALGGDMTADQMWCSRCKHIYGGPETGFVCNHPGGNYAQSAITERDDGQIGVSTKEIRRACCQGNAFEPRHESDPFYDDDITAIGGYELQPGYRYCSRCSFITGNTVDGFICTKNYAQTTVTQRDDGLIGFTKYEIQKECCSGEAFAPRHPNNPEYDGDII